MLSVNEAAFPWLTLLIVLAAVAALVLWLVKPLHKTRCLSVLPCPW